MANSGAEYGGIQSVSAADSTILVTGGTTAPEIKANVGTAAGTVAAGNDSRFGKIGGVTVTGTPSAGNVPIADGPAAAHWGAIPSGGGTGDVVGPAGATSGNIPLFDGTTGKLLKDSGLVPLQLGTTAGTALAGDTTAADIGGLQLGTTADTALAGDTTAADIGGLQLGTTADTALAGDTTAADIGGVTPAGPVSITTIWGGTQAQYDALGTYDPATLYVVTP